MKSLIITLIAAMLVNPAAATTTTTNVEKITENMIVYHELAAESSYIELYNSEDLTEEILENRNGKIIVEEIIGKCINTNGDGIVLGIDTEYNYISYKYAENIKVGDIVCTYCIYNPDTSYTDDIIERYDYVLTSAENNI